MKQKKLLIAEDEESNYELLKAMLRKREVEVVWVQNGKLAIDICEKDEFALILMDIKMPEMNGYETIRILRERGVTTPVIAQTAYARLEDEELAYSKGFNGYISKPINQHKLLEIIDRFL